MARNNAERQAAYRAKHLETGERLSMIIGVTPKRSLERMASYYRITQREMLEKVLIDAERATVRDIGNADADNYYDMKISIGKSNVTR